MIPTSGVVRADKNGFRLVMGEDVATEALKRFPRIDHAWGEWVRLNGNVPCPVSRFKLVSFPIKRHHTEPGDLGLVRSSALRLLAWACREDPEEVFLPRVMCWGLSWSQVRPLLEGLLDDRFVVLY